MHHTHDYQQLLEACSLEGCLLCRLTQESIKRYLDAWKYEFFTDVAVREELRHSQGFCNVHTWQLAQMGASLQLAQAYRDILTDSIEQLQSESKLTIRLARKPKKNRSPCPACHQTELRLHRLVASLRHALLDDIFYSQFLASDGLCLEHFRLTCELKLSNITGDWLSLLREAQLHFLQRLDKQIGEMIRKHDFRFKDEARGTEMISWRRVAGFVAGEDK